MVLQQSLFGDWCESLIERKLMIAIDYSNRQPYELQECLLAFAAKKRHANVDNRPRVHFLSYIPCPGVCIISLGISNRSSRDVGSARNRGAFHAFA